MNPTKRNHINPCFWTALWNEAYFNNLMSDRVGGRAREQKVYSLDFKSCKVLYKKVDDIHYVERLGLASVTEAELLELYQIYPNIRNQMTDVTELGEDESLVIDIENHFSILENCAGYQELMKTIRNNVIANENDRILLACFVVFHQIRSYHFINALFAFHKESSNPKLKGFIHFKELLSNRIAIIKKVKPIVEAKWTIYRTTALTFPNSDFPIIYDNNLIMIALSPKHLLEIDVSKKFGGRMKYINGISEVKLAKFKKLLIKNAFDAIISHSRRDLEKIKRSQTWQLRKRFLTK